MVDARSRSVTWGKTRVRFVKGDITEQAVDAIVNAANSSLLGGGGVDGAIHMKGGPAILEECRRIRKGEWPQGLPGGRAVLTTGGRLRARKVIHTVGPVWRGGREREADVLAECYRNSLELAKKEGLETVSFPSIGTGAYGYPMEAASAVALGAVKEFVDREGKPAEVTFVLFTEGDLEAYLRTLARLEADGQPRPESRPRT